MKSRRNILKSGESIFFVALFTFCCSSAIAVERIINVGVRDRAAEFGFGWGRPQRQGERRFAWIRNHLEADIWIELEDASSADFEIMAAAYQKAKHQQALGLYINNRFVKEWAFAKAEGMEFEQFSCIIPSGMLKTGRNRITLRAGYTGSKGHAVAVDWIRLNLHESVER